MIRPTEADIGRKVVYRARADAEPEEGVISSISQGGSFVFARFRGPTGELTPTNRLEWADA